MPMVQGWCDPAFKTVHDAFAASFSDRLPDQDREHGAALAAIVDGKILVDLWGGWADKAATRPWTRDTCGVVMSQTKGWTAIVVHSLAEAGLLNLDKPIAEIWPVFAANGKDAITTAHVLDHSAGIPFVQIGTRKLGFDQTRWERAIEEAPALHAPGERHIYHPPHLRLHLRGYRLPRQRKRHFRATVAEGHRPAWPRLDLRRGGGPSVLPGSPFRISGVAAHRSARRRLEPSGEHFHRMARNRITGIEQVVAHTSNLGRSCRRLPK
jgi:Beta-lactamase